jgi:AcrR family transcriptional regulator
VSEPTLRSQHVEATRRAVLSAARSLFGSRGYAGTSVDAIAAEARVTKGAVYHHFASKEALFRAVYVEVETDAQGRAFAAIEPDRPAVEQLVAVMQAYLDAALDEEIRRITLIDGPALLALEPDAPEFEQGTELARTFIADAIARGELIDVDPRVLAQLIGGLALQGGVLIARAAEPESARAALGQAIEAMLRGLAPR